MLIGKAAPIATTVGQLGSTFINDTADHTGQWGVIYCIGSCAFSTLTSGKRLDNRDMMLGILNGITLLPGMTIYGYFTAIKLAGGSVIAYEV
jgi:hypothetical protein